MLVITLPAGNHERFFAEAGEPKANASEPMSTEPPDRALAHLATVMPDRSPHVTPVGVDYDGIHILINTVRGRRKERNMRQRPQVGLTIVDPTNPWHWLSIRGHVVAVTEEGADEHLKKLVKKYTGSDDTSFFRRPGQVYVIYKIEPDRVIATPPPQW